MQVSLTNPYALRVKYTPFRILVIGRANAGKTTLLRRVCNSTEDPCIYDENNKNLLEPSSARGIHDIHHPFAFKSNPGFIFHDSPGFEIGDPRPLLEVMSFLEEKAKSTDVDDQLHAIWFCFVLNNARPLMPLETEFFETRRAGKVPVIAIFTKFDDLMTQIYDINQDYDVNRQNAEEQVEKKFRKPLYGYAFPPCADVCFEALHTPETDKHQDQVKVLIGKTASSLDDTALELLSMQQNNIELCIEYAINDLNDKKGKDRQSELERLRAAAHVVKMANRLRLKNTEEEEMAMGESLKQSIERPDHNTNMGEATMRVSGFVISLVEEAAALATCAELKQAAAVTLIIIETIQAVKDNKEAYKQLGDDLEALIVAIWRSYKKAESPKEWLSADMEEVLVELTHTLDHICLFVRERLARSKVMRVIYSRADVYKIAEYRESINSAFQKFELQSRMKKISTVEHLKQLEIDHQAEDEREHSEVKKQRLRAAVRAVMGNLSKKAEEEMAELRRKTAADQRYGYGVSGLVVNKDIGNVTNSIISNVGNDSSAQKVYRISPLNHLEVPILPEDLSEGVLEGELIEAAFAICFPNQKCTTFSAPRTLDEPLDSAWNGGCILSVWDSDLADAWVDKNYNQALLVLIRKSQIGGPIPSMLFVDSAALTIFGTMSVFLMRVAQELADFSDFPVIVRALKEDPSRFRNHECGFTGYTATDNEDKAGGNATHGGTKQGTSSVQSGLQGGRTYNPADGLEKKGKQQEGDGDSDDEEEDPTPPSPPPSPPPIQGASTPKEVIHKTDVTLKLSNNPQNKGHFLRVITKVRLYPPNVKDPDNHARAKMASEPSIDGHVDLQIQRGRPIVVDNILGSVGFLAQSTGYLETEYLVPRGYSVPKRKLKRVMGKQHSTTVGGTLGVAGGKPAASFNATIGRSTSSTTEFADDEVYEQWLVSRQQMICNQDSEAFSYRGLNTMIWQYQLEDPTSTNPCDDVQVKYGIAVEVANTVNKATPQISFIYRHQIHCWVEGTSKSGVRGLIVLAAHFIPDIFIEHGLRIRCSPTLDLPNVDIGEGSKDESGTSSKQDIGVQRIHGKGKERMDDSSQGTSKDHYVFAAAAAPTTSKMKNSSWVERSKQRLFRVKGTGEQEMTLPVSTLVSLGSQPTPLGWDHTNKKWYYPIWPELDCNLSPSLDKLTTRWKMEWGDEAGRAMDSETSGTSVAKTRD